MGDKIMSKFVASILAGIILSTAIPVNAVEYKSNDVVAEYKNGVKALIDGKYVVPVRSMHIDKEQESMASNYVSKEGIVEVSQGKMFLVE